MCQSYRPFILKLLGNHCLNVVRETMQKKHQLCLKPEEELRELRNHYKNRDEDSVTHLRKEAKLGSSMRLHRKIGTGNMDKMLDKMLDYRLGSARALQLFRKFLIDSMVHST
ncbi:putative ATP-dependent helicase [Trichinella spiralis]|uniref:putative ATP-dependent helicase n=1 Tax=Trichinella spiralis TaxID=6334 RepID=UPI0001EFDFA6|nr:putative ATP-dependent helicase [Trichinella spiralis]